MTTLTPTRLAQMPRVNLLPPEIAAAAKLRRLKIMLGLLVLGAMVLVVLGSSSPAVSIGGAEESLVDAQTEGAQLQAEVADLRRGAAGAGARWRRLQANLVDGDDAGDPLVLLPQ